MCSDLTATHCVRVIICGRVQGVYFRASAAKEANALGLRGSATNLADGSVEVIAQGSNDDIQVLLDWLHRGPSLARVDSVKWEIVEPNLNLADKFGQA